MSESEVRLEKIINKINDLKTSLITLKSERDELQIKVTQLENEKIQKRKEEAKELSTPKEELKEEIDRHIGEIDACLDLLKTI